MVRAKRHYIRRLIWLTVVNRKLDFLSLFLGLFVTGTQGIGRDRAGLATFDQSDIRVSRRMTCLRRGAASLLARKLGTGAYSIAVSRVLLNVVPSLLML